MHQGDILVKAVHSKRLSHVYIFSGNDLAQKEKQVENLILLLDVQKLDVFRVAPVDTQDIKISQVRDLQFFLSMTAWISPYKIGVVSDASRMSRDAQTALLKILEEPRGDVIFFLLCEHAHALLDTIRSRSQEIKFYNFMHEELLEKYQEQFEKLRSMSIQERFAYAKKLTDSSEQAIEILQGWLASARKILLEEIQKDSQTIVPLHRATTVIQETLFALQTTNVNPRLALEYTMLYI